MAQCTRTTNDKHFVAHLISFEEPQKVFQKFSCTVPTDESEASLSFLAMFDAVRTEAVASFQNVLQDLKQKERCVAELEHSFRQMSQRYTNKTKSYVCYGKEMSFPTKMRFVTRLYAQKLQLRFIKNVFSYSNLKQTFLQIFFGLSCALIAMVLIGRGTIIKIESAHSLWDWRPMKRPTLLSRVGHLKNM